jgi:NitT/TauT family transport system substrate-binding protein
MFFKRTICLLFSLTLLLSACQPINPSNSAATAPAAGDEAALPDLGTLQIAFVPIIDAAPFFVAVDKGYFAEQGLQVELQSVRSVDEMLAPLSTGKIDMTQMGITTGFLNARQQQLDFRIVAGVVDPTVVPSESTPFLVVSKALADSGEITKVADLKGHKIAINLRGNVLEFFLSKGLEQAGLTLDDVEMVTVPRAEMLVAIENGAVDGAVAGILNLQAMIDEGVAVPLLADTDVPASGARGGVVFGQRLLEPANREVAIRLMVAYLQAARYLNDGGWDDPAVIASVATYTGMDAALIKRSSNIVYAANGEIDDAGILEMQAFQISRGYVEYTEALPVAEMVDLSILSEALVRLAQK